MKSRQRYLVLYALVLLTCRADAREKNPAAESVFEQNKGQLTDQYNNSRADVLFYGVSEEIAFFLRKDGVSYQLQQVRKKKPRKSHQLQDNTNAPVAIYRLDMTYVGANVQAVTVPGGELKSVSNYYLSHCPDGITGVQQFREVVYENLYPNIDLRYYFHKGLLRYDFIVRPGGDPSLIKIKADGASSLRLKKDGTIVMNTPFGAISEGKPEVFQGGKIVEGQWQIEKNVLSFILGSFNPKELLIIDPLVFKEGKLLPAFYGGSGSGAGGVSSVIHLANDENSNFYITSENRSWNGPFTVSNSSQINSQVYDSNSFQILAVAVATSSSTGGGSVAGGTTAVDPQGNIFLSGHNSVVSLATSGAHQQIVAGNFDAFLSKYDPSGTLLWRTQYGGTNNETGKCVVDALGNVYLYGTTSSFNGMATASSHQAQFGGSGDGYLSKFTTNGMRVWGTYFGGSLSDSVFSATIHSGKIFLVGNTMSLSAIATPGSFQPTKLPNSGTSGMAACFDTSGTLSWASYFGNYATTLKGCATDNLNNLYVCGRTVDSTIPATSGAFQAAKAGGTDGIITKFDIAGNRVWCSYYGGTGFDVLNNLCLDDLGNLYVVGNTNSAGLSTPYSFINTVAGNSGLVSEFDTSGQRIWSSYIHGQGYSDFSLEACIVAGKNFISGGSARRIGYNLSDGFIFIFNRCLLPPPVIIANGPTEFCFGDSIMLSVNVGSGSVVRWMRNGIYTGVGASLTVKTSGNYVAWIDSCANAFSQPVNVRVSNPLINLASQSQVPCTGVPTAEVTINVNGGIFPYSYSWTGSTANAPTVSNLDTGYYTVVVTDSIGCRDTQSVNITRQPHPTLQGTTSSVPCTGVPYTGTITLVVSGGNPPYQYLLNNLPHDSNFIQHLSGGNHTITVKDNIGCSATELFHIDSANAALPSNPIVSLCAVTVDSSSGYNKIIWEKNGFVQAKFYHIYRQSTSGMLTRVATVPRHGENAFLDEETNPKERSFVYAISEEDSCGGISGISASHKTIHLTATAGLGGEINLNWNAYDGIMFQSFNISRNKNGGAYSKIMIVDKSITTYSDINPPEGNIGYIIDIDLPQSCRTPSGIINRVVSNRVEIKARVPIILPNPTTDHVWITGVTPSTIRVFDLSGKLLLEIKEKDEFSVEHFHRGVYIVCLYDETGLAYFRGKLIKR